MKFEFATATRILFGPGTVAEAASAAKDAGRCVLLVTGGSPGRARPLFTALDGAGAAHASFSVAGEPTVDTVLEGLTVARAASCDVVIGLGGGSVLDTGKAIAALLTNGGEPLDYLEGIGRGKPLTKPAAPCIAIPTTAGTGSEVTRNAVLGSPDHKVKVSMRSSHMLPYLAIVDPELTYDLPPALTASTGLDALTQLMEAFVSSKATPLTDGICREGLARASRALRTAFHRGDDEAAREDMALASLFSGLALANAGLGAVHGFAGPLGGLYPAPHGALCARLLPSVMETNIAALRRRHPDAPALHRYGEVARILTGEQSAIQENGVAWVRDLCTELDVPPLSSYGVRKEEFSAVCRKARKASSMKGNPVELTDRELTSILEASL